MNRLNHISARLTFALGFSIFLIFQSCTKETPIPPNQKTIMATVGSEASVADAMVYQNRSDRWFYEVVGKKTDGRWGDHTALANKPNLHVLAGDSWVSLWPYNGFYDMLKDSYLSRGFGGSKWIDQWHYIADISNLSNITEMIFYLGENEFRLDGNNALNNIKYYSEMTITTLRKLHPNIRITVMSQIACPNLWRFRTDIDRANAFIKQLLSTMPNTSFIEVNSKFRTESGPIMNLFLPVPNDANLHNLHPTIAGWKVMAEAILANNNTTPPPPVKPQPPVTPQPPTKPQPPVTQPSAPKPIPPQELSRNTIPHVTVCKDVNLKLSTKYWPNVYPVAAKDPDGYIANIQWIKSSGPAVYNISSPRNATTRISNLTTGIYQFRMIVTDNKGASAYDDVKITVTK